MSTSAPRLRSPADDKGGHRPSGIGGQGKNRSGLNAQRVRAGRWRSRGTAFGMVVLSFGPPSADELALVGDARIE